MSNVLSGLAAVLYSTGRVIPKEMTALIGVAGRDFDDKQVAKGGTVKVPVVPRMTVGSIPVPSMTFTAGGDRTPATIDFALNQTAEVSWNLTGEEERALENGGNAQEVLRQTVENGWRGLRNQIEAYLGTVAKNAASRAVGVAGTTPFATNTDLLVDARKILVDNGSQSKRHAVLNSAAEANLLKIASLQKVNEIGSADTIREGRLGRLHGMDLSVSAGIALHAKGTGAGYTAAATGFPIGTVSVPIITGVGTVLAGDVVTFAGDANNYVVKTGVAAPGTIVLQEPGLIQALPAAAQALTIGNASTDNLVLSDTALKVVVRPILQPVAADIEQLVLADPDGSGISCLLLRKVGDQMASWYMRAVYDAFAPNPYEIAKLRG